MVLDKVTHSDLRSGARDMSRSSPLLTAALRMRADPLSRLLQPRREVVNKALCGRIHGWHVVDFRNRNLEG
jgi:hypothetical protein